MYVFVLLLSFLHFGNALLLPNPSGPYPVALKINTMTDNHRIDPYAPDRQKRRILTSIFWPVDSKSCSSKRVPYMPPATAAAYGAQAAQLGLSNDTFSVLEMEVCSVSKTSACQSSSGHNEAKFPLAVFSPGSGNSRLQYSAMARSLASYGYVVVLVDHPYDASIVEFPDGSIIAGGNIPEDEKNLENATQVRNQSSQTWPRLTHCRSELPISLLSFLKSKSPPSRTRSSRVCQERSIPRRLLPLVTP